MASDPKEYVLGTSDEELVRLGLQHQLWRAQAYAVWEQAGFAPGQHLIDLGPGPGYTTLDLAELVGPSGEVLGVDLSSHFLELLTERARVRGLTHVRTAQGDLNQIDLATLPATAAQRARGGYHGAYARWVFCFLPPQSALAGLAEVLAPGAALVVQDYLDWGSIGLHPEPAVFTRIALAVQESWRRNGGDPRVGGTLTGLCERNGLKVERLQPIMRIARPADPLWRWPDSFFRSFVPLLVQKGMLSDADRQEFFATWDELAKRPDTIFVSPLMLDLVARKA